MPLHLTQKDHFQGNHSPGNMYKSFLKIHFLPSLSKGQCLLKLSVILSIRDITVKSDIISDMQLTRRMAKLQRRQSNLQKYSRPAQ